MNFKQYFLQALKKEITLPEEQLLQLIETPPDPKLGDFAFPCFVLSKELKKSPQAIAEELATTLESAYFVSFKATGPYLNAFVKKELFFEQLAEATDLKAKEILHLHLEHNSANPNKPLHIGHARNICIGDSIYRVLTARGHTVDVGHYGDDSGVNVGKNVLGHLYYGYPLETEKKFDHYCGEIYTAMQKKGAEEDTEYETRLSDILHKIEHNTDPELTALHEQIVDACTKAQMESCFRLGIYYDMITWETDILHLKLFEHTLERLKETKYVFQIDEGKGAGCWVIDLREVEEFAHLEFPFQVLVKPDGVATYAAKDIVYAMWKLGYLEKDFHYKKFMEQPNGKTMYSTSSKPEDNEQTNFGNYQEAIAVIDDRQSHEQNVVKTALKILGYENDTKKYDHMPYGIVYITPKTLLDFGFALTDEEKSEKRLPFASRKGWMVTIDEALDLLHKKAYEETKKRNEEASEEWLHEVAEKIAISSFRFMLTKFDTKLPLTFDIDDALDMQGSTGAYALYSYARMCNVFAQGNITPESLTTEWDVTLLTEDIELELAKKILQFHSVLDMAANKLAPNLVCNYVIELCQLFNSYYAKCSFLKAEENVKHARLHLLAKAKARLKEAMNLVGIEELEKM